MMLTKRNLIPFAVVAMAIVTICSCGGKKNVYLLTVATQQATYFKTRQYMVSVETELPCIPCKSLLTSEIP